MKGVEARVHIGFPDMHSRFRLAFKIPEEIFRKKTVHIVFCLSVSAMFIFSSVTLLRVPVTLIPSAC